MSDTKTKGSILKHSSTGERGSAKKIAFSDGQLTADKGDTEEETSFNERILLAPNQKLTSIGYCYVPPGSELLPTITSKFPQKQHYKSKRADFRLLFKETSDMSLLIIGENILTERFRQELEKVVERNHPSDKINCKVTANPTYEEIVDRDFFVFLISLEKFDCISELRSVIKEVRKYLKCLSIKGIVVGVSSSIGPYADAVPLETCHNLLVEFQIPYFSICFVKRERKTSTFETIYSTIANSCKGNNSDPLVAWGLNCPAHCNDTFLT